MLHLWHRENCGEITALLLHLNQGKLQQTYLVTSSNEAWWVIFHFLYSTRQITFHFYKQISQLYFKKWNIFWFNFFSLYKNQRSAPLLLFAIIIPIDNLLVVEGQVSQVLSGYFQVICDARCHHYQGFQVLPSKKKTLEGYKCASSQDTIDKRQARTHRGSLLLFVPLHILY